MSEILTKIEQLINKLRGSYSSELFTAIKIFLESESGKLKESKLKTFYESVEATTDNFPLNYIIIYWYLAKTYQNINEIDKSLKCHNKSKMIINSRADRISGLKDRNTFYNTYFNKRIQEFLI